MIAQKNRFHGHGSLRYVYKNGKAERSHLMTIKYTTNPFRDRSRVSVIVSKKILKSAVGRNRIRRRVFEIIRELLPHFNDTYDIAIIVSSAETRFMPHSELKQCIISQLDSAGIVNASDH